jgi:hypothetical protein
MVPQALMSFGAIPHILGAIAMLEAVLKAVR